MERHQLRLANACQFGLDSDAMKSAERSVNAAFNRLSEAINVLTKAKVCDFIESLITDEDGRDAVFDKLSTISQAFIDKLNNITTTPR